MKLDLRIAGTIETSMALGGFVKILVAWICPYMNLMTRVLTGRRRRHHCYYVRPFGPYLTLAIAVLELPFDTLGSFGFIETQTGDVLPLEGESTLHRWATTGPRAGGVGHGDLNRGVLHCQPARVR